MEKWLIDCESIMNQTMQEVVRKSFDAYSVADRIDWVLQWPGQAIICVDCMFWTIEGAEAVRSNNLVEYSEKLSRELLKIVNKVGKLALLPSVLLAHAAHSCITFTRLSIFWIVLYLTDKLLSKVRGKLSSLERKVLGSLVVIDVHARDVISELSGTSITDETDFEWMSQLRYGWEDGKVMVRMVNAAIRYGYEYLGVSSRLVITPLTDR